MGWGWLEGARATGSCKARPGLRGTDSHRQRPGALRWAVSGPAPLASHAVRSGCAPTPRAGLKPQGAAAAVGAGAHPGGNRAPLLPDCPSRVRCWPCPWRSHCHLACTAAAQPPAGCRLPGGGGGVCAAKTQVRGSSVWHARLELLRFWDSSPAGPLAGLCRLRLRLPSAPLRSGAGSRQVPITSQPSEPSWGLPYATSGHRPARGALRAPRQG